MTRRYLGPVGFATGGNEAADALIPDARKLIQGVRDVCERRGKWGAKQVIPIAGGEIIIWCVSRAITRCAIILGGGTVPAEFEELPWQVGSFLFLPVKWDGTGDQLTFGEPYADPETGEPIPGTDGGPWPQQKLLVRTDGGVKVDRNTKEAMFPQDFASQWTNHSGHYRPQCEQWWADERYNNVISIYQYGVKDRYAALDSFEEWIHNGTYWWNEAMLGIWMLNGRFIMVRWDWDLTYGISVYADTGIDPGYHTKRTWEKLDSLELCFDGGIWGNQALNDRFAQPFWASADGTKAASFVYRGSSKETATTLSEIDVALAVDGEGVITGAFTLTDVSSEYAGYTDTMIGETETASYTATSTWFNASSSLIRSDLYDAETDVIVNGCDVTPWATWAQQYVSGQSSACNYYSNCVWNDSTQSWDLNYDPSACDGDAWLGTGIWSARTLETLAFPDITDVADIGSGSRNGVVTDPNDSPCAWVWQWEYSAKGWGNYAHYTSPRAWAGATNGQPVTPFLTSTDADIRAHWAIQEPPGAYTNPSIPDEAVMTLIDPDLYPVDYAEGLALIEEEETPHGWTWNGVFAEFDWGPLDGAHIEHKWRPAFTSTGGRSWAAEHVYQTSGPAAAGAHFVKTTHVGSYLLRAEYQASGKRLLAIDYQGAEKVRLTLEYSGSDYYDVSDSVNSTGCGITTPAQSLEYQWTMGQKAEFVCGSVRLNERSYGTQPGPGFGSRFSMFVYDEDKQNIGIIPGADLRTNSFSHFQSGYSGATAKFVQGSKEVVLFNRTGTPEDPPEPLDHASQIATDVSGNTMFCHAAKDIYVGSAVFTEKGPVSRDLLNQQIFGETSDYAGTPYLSLIPCRPMCADGVAVPEYEPFGDPWNR